MSPAPTLPDAPLGRLLGGRFRLERELARGGMATVYRAIDERLARPVAVKVLAASYAEQPAFVDRFLWEARTAASISHPNLAHVYDSGSDGDIHFIVLELLERHRSLRDVLRERGRLDTLEAIHVTLDVLAGLEDLHAHGLVHCDVKPGNVMIGTEPTKLIDFGIARPLVRPVRGATSLGSLHAMSPEQLRGERLTPSSDLFAVGVLFYECLTGRVPFPGTTPAEVAAAHGRGSEQPPSHVAKDVAAPLDDVVLQALRLDAGRRFVTAKAMATALRTAAAAQREAAASPAREDDTTAFHPVAPSVAAAPPPARFRGRWVGLAAAAAMVAAIVIGIGPLGSGEAGGRGTASPTPTAAASADPEPSLAPGMVRVPDTIGMSEAEAQAAAQRAGLAWRIEWRIVSGREPGIYAQEPRPGAVVREGSAFVMQAYRDR